MKNVDDDREQFFVGLVEPCGDGAHRALLAHLLANATAASAIGEQIVEEKERILEAGGFCDAYASYEFDEKGGERARPTLGGRNDEREAGAPIGDVEKRAKAEADDALQTFRRMQNRRRSSPRPCCRTSVA